jgi:hypothetical protein
MSEQKIYMTPEQAKAIKEQAASLMRRGRNPDGEYSIVLQQSINSPAFIRTRETAEAIDDVPGPFYKLSELAGIEEA